MADVAINRRQDQEKEPPPSFEEEASLDDLINVSGHVQEVDRKLGLWSLCAIGIAADNAWGAGAGSLAVALYNGGSPGVLWEFIVVCLFYACIAAALAELSSSIPSSANVYHWASVAGGPKYGRILSYFAGYWNWMAWNFGTCFGGMTFANTIIAMYNLYHPDYVYERWHAFIVYVIVTWLDVALILYGQRVLPYLGNISGFLCLICWFIVTMVCAIMPAMSGTSASNDFVWVDFQNNTGYVSSGFVFLAGTLNGAFAIGTPDGVCHLAEEIPDPKRNVPKGILCQMTTGCITTLSVYISLMYAITSLPDVFASQIVMLPLATVFQQATQNSTPATMGLLFIFALNLIIALPAAYISAGRMLWTLGRDNATPFAGWFGAISPTWRNQFNATLFCGAFSTAFGAIYIGSPQAFSAFVDCFTILTTFSYLAAIAPHLLSRRAHITPGPFWMPAPWGYIVGGIACAYIVVFNGVIYFFPFALPVNAVSMNYSCVIVGGLTALLVPLYFYKVRHGYTGPQVAQGARNDIMKAVVMVDVGKSGAFTDRGGSVAVRSGSVAIRRSSSIANDARISSINRHERE